MILPQRATAPRHVVLYFDFADPASYLAAVRAPAICAAAGASLTLEPVAATALPGYRAPDAVSLERARRAAAAAGIPLVVPASLPFDSRPLVEACLFVRDRSGQDAMLAVAERIWQEIWQRGTGPGPELAIEAARAAAVPVAALAAAFADPARLRAMLDRVVRRAVARGVLAVPAIAIEGEILSGPEALDELGALLRDEAAGPRKPEGRPPGAGGLPDWTFSG